MPKISSNVDNGVEEAVKVLDEYKFRLKQVLNDEGEKIREEAEREAAEIVASACEERDKIRSEAERESAKIIVSAHE
jgi:F0F1-type ATP synthase membrane subunit b/b'